MQRDLILQKVLVVLTSVEIQSLTLEPASFCPGHQSLFLLVVTVRVQLTIWGCFQFLQFQDK